MKIAYTLLLAWLMLCSSTTFGAIVNGGFEDPVVVFNGWDQLEQVVGQTSIVGAYGGGPVEGAKQALITTTDTAGKNLTALAGFLSVPEAIFSASIPDAFNGSAIRQTVSVNKGDTLKFSWNFLTNETIGSSLQDTAFLTLSFAGGTAQVLRLASPSDTSNDPSAPGFERQTTYQFWESSEFTEAQAGTYVIGFGVVNKSDGFTNSGLLIDNVQLSAVPEPTALAGLGLVGLTLTMRRRRRK